MDLVEGYPRTMNFDPAIAARDAFRVLEHSRELGQDWAAVSDAEAIFSADAGIDASHAYQLLQEFGLRHPEAKAFQEFLIYITWQQVVEQTDYAYFRKGLELCDRFLARWGSQQDVQVAQIAALRASFRAGLGLGSEEPDEYDKDTIKGGD